LLLLGFPFPDCTKMGVGGKAIPPSIERVTEIKGSAKFVLIVEKDAAFMRLAEDRFYNTYPCVIITGKGQPDVATRLFVKRVREALNIPVLCLVDADPYGLKVRRSFAFWGEPAFLLLSLRIFFLSHSSFFFFCAIFFVRSCPCT
jgi:meiotic recombination protein SPO11